MKEKALKILCLFIIVGVCSVITTVALLAVREGIVDKHSSVSILDGYISGTPAKADGTVAMNPTALVSYTLPSQCPAPFVRIADRYQGSLVNYLSAKGEDYSFASREKYAEEIGLQDYEGVYGQNQVLLMNLLIKAGELPALDSSSCKGA